MLKALTAVGLSLALLFQLPIEATPAHAVTCATPGGQSGRLKYSGQISPISATVCGNQIWKLIGKPKKPTKPAKPVNPGKPKKYANKFTVTPDRPGIGGTAVLKVGEIGEFGAIAKRHIRNRLLFWYPAQVRFVPKTYLWNFGDGGSSGSNLVEHSWLKPGTYTMSLTVGFTVKYRIIGHSTWVPLSGLVFAKSTPWNVQVGSGVKQSGTSVVLVHWLCTQKPMAVGC
ncbi:MAG: PKD domain-containing protein [Micrococcales bacterium]